MLAQFFFLCQYFAVAKVGPLDQVSLWLGVFQVTVWSWLFNNHGPIFISTTIYVFVVVAFVRWFCFLVVDQVSESSGVFQVTAPLPLSLVSPGRQSCNHKKCNNRKTKWSTKREEISKWKEKTLFLPFVAFFFTIGNGRSNACKIIKILREPFKNYLADFVR